MAAKLYAFSGTFDAIKILILDFLLLLKKQICVDMFNMSKPFIVAIARGRGTAEKLLIVDIKSAREASKEFKITSIKQV